MKFYKIRKEGGFDRTIAMREKLRGKTLRRSIHDRISKADTKDRIKSYKENGIFEILIFLKIISKGRKKSNQQFEDLAQVDRNTVYS